MKGGIDMDFASFDSQEMPGGGWVVKNHTIYVNPYFVYNGDGYIQDHIPDRFTKHYYAGSERIASRLNREGQSANAHNALANIYTPAVPDQPYLNDLRAVLTAFGMNDQLDSDPAPYPENPIQSESDCYEIFNADQLEYERCLCLHFPAEAALQSIECSSFEPVYWYHPDYLGHTDFVTDRTGQPYQHFFYAPFGEALLSQHTGTGYYNTPYRFNAKELDSETGFVYYGARYYEPKESVWLSVDRFYFKYPHLSNYSFSGNNPVLYYDVNGDSLRMTAEGYEINNIGLTATLGTNHPIGYDAKNSKMVMNQYNRNDYNSEQLMILDHYEEVINSTLESVLIIVGYNEPISEIGMSLNDRGSSGATVAYSFKDDDGNRVVTNQNIYIARDPVNRQGEREENYYVGIIAAHEIGGHSYYNIAMPQLPPHLNNQMTEYFENLFRSVFQLPNGTFLNGEAQPHE